MTTDDFRVAESINKRTLALTHIMDNSAEVCYRLQKRIGRFNILRDILNRYNIVEDDGVYVENQLNECIGLAAEDIVINLKMEVQKLNQQFASL